MRGKLKAGALIGAALILSGCAGIPTAVSFAGMYVNSLLVLRTNKGMTDHVVSAAMDQDCGVVNVFEHGSFCIDAPAPQLLAAMSADADMLRPAAAAPAAEAAATPPTPTAVETAQAPTRTTVSFTTPPPAAPPTAKPVLVSNAKAVSDANPVADRFLVVLASYRNPHTAAAHQARLKRADSIVVAVDVNGAAYHRVALRAGTQTAALRTLSQVKAAGSAGAWMVAGIGAPVPAPVAPAPAPSRRPPAAPTYAAAPIAPPLL